RARDRPQSLSSPHRARSAAHDGLWPRHGGGRHSEAWELLRRVNPDIVLIEWMDGELTGLDFVRRVRMSPEAPNRAAAVFMLTKRGAQSDVETARMAGVDGYMIKPVSALTLQQRLATVVLNPQPFVVTATYVGPCRRRRRDDLYDGPLRRLDDPAPAKELSDPEESEVKAQLARARVAMLEAAVRNLAPGDIAGARVVFKAATDLQEVAEQIGDSVLTFASREMMRYLQAQGATARLDPEVVRTHVAALHQLAHLPHALGAERDSVAQGLKRMVDKKLRQATA